MLNATNTLTVGPFLDVLMFPIGGNDRSRVVARCRVKNPYVKICILCSSPEPSGSNVKTGFICGDGRAMGHGFTTEVVIVVQWPRCGTHPIAVRLLYHAIHCVL